MATKTKPAKYYQITNLPGLVPVKVRATVKPDKDGRVPAWDMRNHIWRLIGVRYLLEIKKEKALELRDV